MKAECVKAIQMAAQKIGKTMTVADMRGIETRIYEARKQLAIKDTETYIGWTREKQIEEAGKLVVQEALHNAIKKRQRAELAVIREAERNTSITHAMASYGIDRMKALARFTMAVADGKGGVISLESHMKGVAASYQRKLTELRKLRTDGWFSSLVTNKQHMLDYIKETFGIDSGNAQAKKAWQQTSKVLDEMIDHFNSKGGDIAKNINWHNPQRHDALRVLKAGERAFVDEHMNLVDRTKYVNPDGSLMDDAQMRKFLKEAFLTISTDGANKPVIPGGNAGTVANRMKAHRQMHYKSPEAYITAMEKFGAGNPFDMLDSHIDGMARNIALAEKFGPNAIFEFNKEYRRAVEETGGTTDSSLKSTFERMSGQRHTENVAMAAKFQAVRDAMVATKLGSMLFAQLVDTATMKMTARAMGIQMREVMAWAYRLATDKELGDLLRIHGFGLETALNESARWADNTSGMGFWGKAAHTVTVIQGAHAWTKWTRQAFAAAMEAKMGELTAKYDSIAKLPELDRKILESKGVTEADWQVWRLAKPTEYKGLKILGSDAIDAIPAAKIAEIVPGKDADDFRRETAIKMVSMNLEETHMAVLQPSERQSFDIKRGNVASELGGLLLQFKPFPWAFLRQHMLERAEFVAGRDNPWVYRVKLFAAATVMGGVVVMMNDIASGKDPQDIIGDPEDPDYQKKMGKFVMKAMLKGGGIGILDELFKGVMEAGENPWRAAGSFLGPAGSYAAGKVLPTAFHGAMALATQDEEEIQKFSKYAYDSAVGITPGQNLWFLKGLLHNVLLHEMHEMANPGYAQRNKERLNRESGQEYWLGMGEETRLPKVGD